MKILDCTLRDGGYLVNWNWPTNLVNDTIFALNQAKVDIIELGYRSPHHLYKDKGAFRFCDETDEFGMEDIKNHNLTDNLGIMIDLRDYISSEGIFNKDSFKSCFANAIDSIFTWLRIAIKTYELDEAVKAIEVAKNLGYKVILSTMYAHSLGIGRINKIIETLSETEVDIIYFADSFGAMRPHQIQELIKRTSERTNKPFGLHLHNNCNIALANALKATDNNVFVDATILGMGRGAGNVDIEQLHMQTKLYNNIHLANVRRKYFEPLKEKYKWGYSLNYHLSAIRDTHPMYVQTMMQNGFSEEEINTTLKHISNEHKRQFHKEYCCG